MVSQLLMYNCFPVGVLPSLYFFLNVYKTIQIFYKYVQRLVGYKVKLVLRYLTAYIYFKNYILNLTVR